MILPRDTIMSWSGNRLTEHNRDPISVTPNRIKKSARMVNGGLRENIVATKQTYSISWSTVPSQTSKTIDGYWGGNDIMNFFETTTGPFVITLRYDSLAGTDITKTVVFSSAPSYEVVGRSTAGFDLVNISVELEEV